MTGEPRRRRRAVGGTPSPEPATPREGGRPRPGTPDPFGRSADDTDTGWGEHPDDPDERLRREVPPHW